jgi:hypothetical protein
VFRPSPAAIAAATRSAAETTVADQSQGVQLAKPQDLVTYCDWRKFEATLNALPQLVTNLDGLDIHLPGTPPPAPPDGAR